MKNAKELREKLIKQLDAFYESSQTDKDLEILDSVSKTSNAILRSAKLELDYAKYKGQSIKIDFLSNEDIS